MGFTPSQNSSWLKRKLRDPFKTIGSRKVEDMAKELVCDALWEIIEPLTPPEPSKPPRG
jgi:hypothetical protein